MYQWKPKKDGTNIVLQYIRHQDDYFHNSKLNLIRSRKNRFLFPKLPKKPSTSYQQYRKEQLKTKPYLLTMTLDKTYYINRDNAYLSNRLNQISTRPKQPWNTYFFYISDKRIKFNNTVRELEQKRIKQENNAFFSRLTTVPSIINRKKMENDYHFSKLASEHLRKIERININNNKSKTIETNK